MSHYIRTVHTDFTAAASRSHSPSPWAYAGTSASAHANLLVGLGGIMSKYPPGLGHSEWRATTGSTGAYPHPPSSSYSRRRTSISLRAPHSAPARRTPPPPRAQPASTTYMKFDPFSDDFSVDAALPPHPAPACPSTAATGVLYRTPRTAPASLSTATAAARIPAAPVEVAPLPPPLDRNARSRLVAGILLNRVHAVGRPMRRRSMEGPREYVKSGLSCVVSVEA
ncbi:hypothetical protein LshimejAT787_0212170 [Lyophyllum shimeji]|uniref:Uncharacterized protein n=1 Tax=Lyophyllum shimeji TaxID=47721 RepID=A0A9P3UJQ0_LYOSH|nr:hypothetical protein LshimejAT787_0212170 [Lyophyllum shimeji]